jgi:hypothetical protein
VFCVDRRKNSDELNDLYEQEAVFTPRYELNLIIIVILVFNTVRVIAQTVSWWLLTAEAQVLSHVSPCEIRNEQSGTGTDSSPGISVFPSQYHSTDAPNSSSSTRCSHQQGKSGKSGDLPKRKVV